ncbi:MAG: sugar phosphate isomerase/epimerase family protein [Phycisphaerae bacterium]|jgi:sugar phosphate isomerase/epimerase|nr:sugar phosphate isomerase/epimerase family protein [Phycisphaerae bacterium]
MGDQIATKPVTRRSFLAGVAGAAAVGLSGRAIGIEPFKRPGKPIMKLSLAAYSMKRYLAAKPGTKGAMDMGGFIDYCAKLRLDGTELTSYWFPKNVTPEYLASLKRRAHLAGLDISGGAIANRFTLPPGKDLDAQHVHVRKWVDHYADLGAPVIRVFAGRSAKGVSETDALKHAVANLQKACAYAGKRGVILGIENHDYVADIERMMTVIGGVKSPWFGVTFDSGNFHSADPYADLAKIAPYAVNAQIKVHMRPAGKPAEEADFKRIIKILRDANYSGYVTLEYEAKEDPYKSIPKYIDKLREAIAG